MYRMSRILLTCALIAMPALANAQSGKTISFAPAPKEETSLYIVQNFRMMYALSGSDLSKPGGRDDFMGSFEGGLMGNVSSKAAVGASAFIALEDNRPRAGVSARVRFWLPKRNAIDFNLGSLVANLEDDKSQNPSDDFGLFAAATFSYRDLVIATVQYERVEIIDAHEDFVYAGIGTGGQYGLLTGIVAFVVAGTIAAASI